MKQLLYILLISLFVSCSTKKEKVQRQPNILFLAVDDLRPELGCYGSLIAQSPNIDQLASRSLVFDRAYCQQAICGVSRPSLLTGTRPETLGIIHNYRLLRDSDTPDVITLPQHFRAHGYETVYCGKIFHGLNANDSCSWSRDPAYNTPHIQSLPKPVTFALQENRDIRDEDKKLMFEKYGEQAKYGLANGPAFECADVPDQTYEDGYNTDLAIATLKDMLVNDPDKPFFLGLGMKKPHLNWIAPQKYWDMYDPNTFPIGQNVTPPINGASMGLHASFELRVRSGIPKSGDISPALSRTCTHAYLSCVSYIDAQIGRMIDALEETGVADNTIIVLWSDHGWHLGEMGIWGKATNYEFATRVPMMIYSPNMPKSSQGKHTNALVELLDIYPTLCDLADIQLPSHLEGQSYEPLIQNPEAQWKRAAFSQFPCSALREWGALPLRQGMRETFFGPLISDVENKIKEEQGNSWDRDLFENHLMGYTMRTDRYRLILWKDRRDQHQEPLYIELYDHKTDPMETKNIANEQPLLTQQLIEQSEGGWNERSVNSVYISPAYRTH